MIPTIVWNAGAVRILDQTRLPAEESYIETTDWRDVALAIRRLAVRGAPAIGVAAAMGVALAAHSARRQRDPLGVVEAAIDGLAATRPTAVNLFWALDRMRGVARRQQRATGDALAAALEKEALRIHAEDLELSERMGEHGATLVPADATIMTICNTGGLATAGLGTALAVVYAAHRQGKRVRVFACETRPLLQGARLTTWELQRMGIDATLIVDSAAASALRSRGVDLVLTGADRIARNGDTANKIGTYSLALAAAAHEVPFAVVAPTTTLDPNLATGDEIPIEERDGREVLDPFGRPIAPPGIDVWNPAFDVTPYHLIEAIVTDHGVHRAPYTDSLSGAVQAAQNATTGG